MANWANAVRTGSPSESKSLFLLEELGVEEARTSFPAVHPLSYASPQQPAASRRSRRGRAERTLPTHTCE